MTYAPIRRERLRVRTRRRLLPRNEPYRDLPRAPHQPRRHVADPKGSWVQRTTRTGEFFLHARQATGQQRIVRMRGADTPNHRIDVRSLRVRIRRSPCTSSPVIATGVRPGPPALPSA